MCLVSPAKSALSAGQMCPDGRPNVPRRPTKCALRADHICERPAGPAHRHRRTGRHRRVSGRPSTRRPSTRRPSTGQRPTAETGTTRPAHAAFTGRRRLSLADGDRRRGSNAGGAAHDRPAIVTALWRPPVGAVALPGTRPAAPSAPPPGRLGQRNTNVCSNQEGFTSVLHMCSNYLHVSGSTWPQARIRCYLPVPSKRCEVQLPCPPRNG
jgi:hypothetical protein